MSSYKFPSSRVAQPALKETVLCGILQFLAFAAVWLRLWSRRLRRKRLQFNDYAILIALFLCTSLLAIAITSTVWSGKGFHTSEVDPAYRSRVFVAFTAGQPVWAAANAAVKLSILHLYLCLFPPGRFHRLCYVLMGLSVVYFISVFLETFLICKPVEYNWNKTIQGTCDRKALETYLAAGIINLLIDIFIVAMPTPMLFRLPMPTGKKIGLVAIFSVGGVICIVSLLRVLYISRMDLHDFHYTYADLGMWSIIEPQLGVINACMPVMRPLLSRAAKSKACQRVLPESWVGSSSEHATQVLVKYDNGKARRATAPVDKLYPLDTVHLVGRPDHSNLGSEVDLEGAITQSDCAESVGSKATA